MPNSSTGEFRQGSTRVAALDGLRGVAAVLVLSFHLDTELLPGLWWGVDLFFVISGFVITRLLAAELARTSQIDLAQFMLRRILRVLPAFAVMMTAFALYANLCTRHGSDYAYAMTVASGFVMNWARAFGTGTDGPLVHCWTLSMEEQFYLLWPIVLMVMPVRNRVPVLIGLTAAVVCWRAALTAHGVSFERTANGFDTRSDGLLIGCLLALAPPMPRLRRLAVWLLPLVLAALAAASLLMSYKSVGAQAFGVFGCVLAAACLVLAALEPSWFSRALSGWPLQHLGRLSYAIYLWHVPILFFGPQRVPPGWVGTAILLAATWAVALLSYVLVERPCLALRHALPAFSRQTKSSPVGLAP